jgi:phospholipid/cholesterol/gamma-HCH transport system substrate-binding protein
MAKRTLVETATGAVVLLLAGGFLAYAVAHSGRTTESGYELHARFDHIDGLNVGSDVRVAGVKVGTVVAENIDPKTYLADVTFTVQDGISLPKDSSAEITSDGLLGSKYVSLAPGGDQQVLRPGQTVTITQGSISLEQLLGKFIFSASNLASSAKGGQNQQTNQPTNQQTGAGGKSPEQSPPK